jgi:catechol 2,3-dioxygenase-like lactoylglutathione lyase family enzyme
MTPPGSDTSARPRLAPELPVDAPRLAAKECLVTVQLNHTIVSAKDKRESATFFAEVLGVAPPTPFGPFLVVTLDNGVSLDFLNDYGLDDDGRVHPQHYAFLVTETEFDEILGRIRARGLPYWADPGQTRLGEINTNDGGRGVYWEDPGGHILEIITRPYGS